MRPHPQHAIYAAPLSRAGSPPRVSQARQPAKRNTPHYSASGRGETPRNAFRCKFLDIGTYAPQVCPGDVNPPFLRNASEDECGRSDKARKHSRGSVKDRPTDHPTFDPVIDHRLCGRRAAMDADKPSV